MAPRVSWRWRHGWHLCGEMSQFAVASGNWQIVEKVVARLAPKEVLEQEAEEGRNFGWLKLESWMVG